MLRIRPSAHVALFAVVLLLHVSPLGAEARFSAYTGTSWTRDSDLRVTQPGLGTDLVARDVHWDAKATQPAPYYGLRLTYFDARRPAWGAALDYTHYKMYADTGRVVNVEGRWRGAPAGGSVPLNQHVQQFELSHGVNVISLNGLYRWIDPRLGQLEPYAGVGVAHYRPHAESMVGGLPFETGYQPSGFGYQVLAGAHYRMTDRTGVFIETKFNSGTARVDIASGRAETPLRTVHLVGGVSYGF